VFALEMWYQNS